MSKPFQESTSISPLLELTDAQRWEVERYVLGDDSFDRQAFEDRMLDDTRLALAVADCVAEVQNLKQACSGLEERVAVEATQVAIARRSWVWLLAGRSVQFPLRYPTWSEKSQSSCAVLLEHGLWVAIATLVWRR